MTDQVTKFNKRYAKDKEDEKAIVEKAIKNQTIEKAAIDIAKSKSVSTEDIFAVITRNSMESFINLWSNSMEDVIRKTVREEMKQVRQVIQEELVGAYTGIMKGMTEAKIGGIINDEITSIIHEQKPNEEKRKARTNKQPYLDELEKAILKAHSDGINVISGMSFKKSSSRNSGLYQRFYRENKGIKGAWNDHVQAILNKK